MPHPEGNIEVEFKFSEGHVTGTVALPASLTGKFIWDGKTITLKPGIQEIHL
jgi:alpha-L-rhamnosidase